MDLSIVIVNWNTREYLRGCLESIWRNPPASQYEVIVVDNASCDGSARMVRQDFPQVQLIENMDNVGYAAGNNAAIQKSTGQYILLLNPDAEVKSGALDSLMAFARDHPDLAAVGCRLIEPNGAIQSSCRSFPNPLSVFFEYTKLSRFFPRSKSIGAYRMTYFDYTREAEVDQPMGSCLLLSRKAVDDVGMFDQDFPIFFNEVDWCYRAKERGWKVYFTPSAEVLHHSGASTRQVRAQMGVESHRALIKFYAKHYKHRMAKPVYWFIVGATALNGFFTSRFRNIGKG